MKIRELLEATEIKVGEEYYFSKDSEPRRGRGSMIKITNINQQNVATYYYTRGYEGGMFSANVNWLKDRVITKQEYNRRFLDSLHDDEEI